MKISYIKGDALKPIGQGHKHIVHICNDLGYWGKGFALSISKQYSEPKKEYIHWKSNIFSEIPFELGNIQSVLVDDQITVVNMIAQQGVFRTNQEPSIRYNMLRLCLTKVVALSPESVHMPRIGTGLGGGEWSKIEDIINKTLIKADIPVFVYDL